MTLIFTICSSNYLAHAKVLGDSLAKSNPDCRFVIGLVDSIPTEIDLKAWMSHEVIPVTEIGISNFDELSEKYNVVELNTAVKPFYMEYFYQEDEAVEHVIYLDPDIVVYNSLSSLIAKLSTHSMIVTPHSCSYDNSEDNIHYEISMLATGIYNLGFIATARSSETSTFLTWWQVRMRDHCYYLTQPGLFVDQIWVSLAPLYFEGFFVEKDPGYNMCYWNHFERTLSFSDGNYFVNGKHNLVFYHFSSYNIDNPHKITSREGQPIATFEVRPDLQLIYKDYQESLIAAGAYEVRPLQCAFGRKPKVDVVPEQKVIPKPIYQRSPRDILKAVLRKSISVMPKRAKNITGRIAKMVWKTCKK
jgi:hypothetical protein